MFRQLFLVFTLGLSLSAIGQSAELKKIAELKSTIQQITFSDSASVFQLGNECIQLAKKINKENEIGYIYQYYGTFYYYSGKVDEAKKYYHKSLAIAEKTQDNDLKLSTKIRLNFLVMDVDINAAEIEFNNLLFQAQASHSHRNTIAIYNGLGILYETKLMDDKATQKYLQGLKIAEKHQLKFETSYLLNNLGLLKLKHKKYKSAKIDLERALILATETNQSRLRLNILNNIGLINKKTNNTNESIEYYLQTVQEAKKLGFPAGVAVAYINLSSTYLDNQNLDLALNYSDSALIFTATYPNIEHIKNAYLIKAQITLEQRKYVLVRSYIDSVNRYQKLNFDAHLQGQLIGLQSKMAQQTGNFKLAYELEQKRSQWNDSILEVTNENEQMRLQTIYGKERMENELKTLQQRNNFLRTKNELKEANQRLVYLSFAILFIGVLVFFYVLGVRKSRKIKSQFSQNLIEQIDLERSRISKDLHDDIGQSLAIVKSKLNLFNTKKIEHINGLDTEIGEILEKTRALSHQIHPAALEKIGLEKALISLLDKTQDATDIVCSMDFEIGSKRIDSETSSQLYRIIQECISNTVKHAFATALKVSFYMHNEELIVKYLDNGIGISSTQEKSGTGLLTIRERIGIIGGKLDIKTGTKKGVVLKITV